MCGIAGFLGSNFNKDQLQAMTNSLQHRGPDAEGYFFDQKNSAAVGLGHRRLSIIDLSPAGNQPMYSANGRYVMIFNGEVYNFESLRKERFEQRSWRSTSDTEVIIELFSDYGPQCFQWLNGIFALAIWDREDGILTLARDHLGIKPLYLYNKDGHIAFSSELKAIKRIFPNLAINREVIPSFLHLGYIVHPHTIYKEITSLSSGAYIQFLASDKGNSRAEGEKRFWSIKDKINKNILSDEKTAKSTLDSLLKDSVKQQLISDVPIGTFLSGGTDSSLVTAIATRVAEKKVKTFSIAVTDGKVNEAPYAAAVAQYLDTEHYELPISQKEILEMIPGFLDVYDEPFCDSSAFPTMLVSKLARKYVTVTLSGDGGDELFWGYGSYLWAKRLQNPVLKLASPLIYAGSRLMNSRYKRIGKLFESHPASHFQSHLFSQDHYFFTEKEISSLLVDPHFDFSGFNYEFNSRELNVIEQASFWDIENYLKDNLLVKVDRASMRFGLETRVPLLDYRIVEFGLNLSPSLKINHEGRMKYLLKEVLYDYVPKSLLERPKWGFGVPLNKWLKSELKWLVDKYCAKDVVEKAGVVKYEKVHDLLKKFYSGRNDYLYNRIWALTVLHWFLNERS